MKLHLTRHSRDPKTAVHHGSLSPCRYVTPSQPYINRCTNAVAESTANPESPLFDPPRWGEGRSPTSRHTTTHGTLLQPSPPPYRFSQHVYRDRHARKDAQQLFDVHAPPNPSPLRGPRPRHLVRPYTLPNIPEPAVQGVKPAAPYDHAKYGARAEAARTACVWREEGEAG